MSVGVGVGVDVGVGVGVRACWCNRHLSSGSGFWLLDFDLRFGTVVGVGSGGVLNRRRNVGAGVSVSASWWKLVSSA